MKRIVGLTLTIIMAIGCLAGCGGVQKGTPEPGPAGSVAGSSNINPPGTLPIVKNTVEFEMVIVNVPSVVLDYETNEMTAKMEAMTNMKVKWRIIASAAESVPLMLASGDYPDVFRTGMTTLELQANSKSGVFIDLKPYIDEYGYYVKDMINYDPNVIKVMTLPDGKIPSLPTYSYTYHMTACNKMWVNRDWLNAVGLGMPTTTDEFYDMLVAFKTKDPNGNGKADEIPLSGISVYSWNSAIPFLMSAFIITDNTQNRYFVQPFKGKVDVVFNKDEWRQGLTYFNRLFSEGLLDPESFTQNVDLRREKVESGLVGAASGNAPSSVALADTDYFKVYDVVPPVKGPNGLQATAFITTGTEGTSVGHVQITDKCKNPAEVFRWLDYLYNEETLYDNLYGNEGVEWAYAEPGEIGINGLPAIWKTLPAFTGVQQNVSWYQNLPTFRRAEWRLGEVGAAPENYLLRSGMETRLYDATKEYEKFYNNDVVPNVIYIDESLATKYNEIRTELYDYMYSCTARFITGDMNLATEWDSYIAELSKIGLEDYINMTQDALK